MFFEGILLYINKMENMDMDIDISTSNNLPLDDIQNKLLEDKCYNKKPLLHQICYKGKKEKFKDFSTIILHAKYKEKNKLEPCAIKKIKSSNLELLKTIVFKEYQAMNMLAVDSHELSLWYYEKQKENIIQYIFMIFLKCDEFPENSDRLCDPSLVLQWSKSLIKQLLKEKYLGYYSYIHPNNIYINLKGKPRFGFFRTISFICNSFEDWVHDINNSPDIINFLSPEMVLLYKRLQSFENYKKKTLFSSSNVYSFALIILTQLGVDVSILNFCIENFDDFNHNSLMNSLQNRIDSIIIQIQSYEIQSLLNAMLKADPFHRKSLRKLLFIVHDLQNLNKIPNEILINCSSSSKEKLKILKKTYGLEIWDNGAVTCLAITNDNYIIISGGQDGTLRFWSIPENCQIISLKGHLHAVNVLKLTYDNKCAISGGKDSKLLIWSIQNKKRIATLSGHKGFVISLCITFDDKFAISGGEDGKLIIWNLVSKCIEAKLEGHDINWRYKLGATCLDIGKDNNLAISGGEDGCLNVWRIAWRCLEGEMKGHVSSKWSEGASKEVIYEGVTCVAITNQRSFAASGGEDGYLRIWDIVMKSQELGIKLHEDGRFAGVRCLEITSNDKFIITGGSDGKVCIYNFEERRLENEYQAHIKTNNGGVICLDLSTDNNFIATGGVDWKICLWDIENKRKIHELCQHFSIILKVKIVKNQYVLSCGNDGIILVWDMMKGVILRNFSGHTGPVSLISVTNNEKYAISGGVYGLIKVWNIKKARVKFEIQAHHDWISCLCTTNNNKYLISGGGDGFIRIWNLFNKILVADFKASDKPIIKIKITKDDLFCISVSEDNKMCLWNLKNKCLEGRITNFGHISKWSKKYPEINAFSGYLLA